MLLHLGVTGGEIIELPYGLCTQCVPIGSLSLVDGQLEANKDAEID